MTEERKVATDPRESLNLKLDEPEVSPDSPWADDILNRAQIAERLTNLIRTQSAPLVISIDGYWGTGKTFMLKRWQKDLENQGFQAIYFNAWEDDFCDDPLLAILGQLSEHFSEGELKVLAAKILQSAKPLLRRNALSILEKHTGITLQIDESEQDDRDFVKEYLAQRATKDEVKKHLERMSHAVHNETGHPLVFIIDELDRCRPTFAIELLERVKHIFDVPNLLFVLGINQDELCKSLKSLYGEIEADIYLRRFFDLEFTLPEVDSQMFCNHLFDKFELEDFFAKFGTSSNAHKYVADHKQFVERIPELWSYFGLSLRDVDYCVRLVSMACKNLTPRQPMYPWLLGLLIALKFNNHDLYQRLIRRQCLASEVMNYVHSLVPQDSGYTMIAHTLSLIEVYLYAFEHRSSSRPRGESPIAQILAVIDDKKSLDELPRPEYLSERVKDALRREEEPMTELLLESIRNAENSDISPNSLKDLVEMIDFHQEMLRR